MTVKRYGIILIGSTRAAIEAEEQAKKERLHVRIVPTPGRIIATCGFSLKYEIVEETAVKNMLQRLHIFWSSVYHAEQQGIQVAYKKQDE